MAQQHGPAAHWSAQNPIPSIQQFVENLDKDKKERDRRIDEEARQRQEQPEKPDKGKYNARQVTDPVTGRDIEIEDVGEQHMKSVEDPKLTVPNANLEKKTDFQTDTSQPLEEYKQKQDLTAPPEPVASGTTTDVPIRGGKTNVLFHPTPTTSYQPMFEELERRATELSVGIVVTVVVLGQAFGGSLWGLIPLAACLASGVYLWMKEVVRSGKEMEWKSEKLRGQTATANLLPESVEWLNAFLGVTWGLLNPEMLAGVADTLEDVMQASVPGIIENVRVAEIDQGNNPVRILSIRSLPDEHVENLKRNADEENRKHKDPEAAAADSEGGEYYNFEVSFAYHAEPSGQSASAKARNMHMQLVFYLGVKGLFGVPFPVFTELIELVGTVRLRLQMTPEPPFAKSLTFSLMGLPHVQAGCVPLVKKGVNILNLPLISNFVNSAISTAASLYVAPKSMSLDLSMMLKGDDIQKDTLALGVVWVRIHRAIGLSKQDKRGSNGGGSDPYINLSFSKYGKPMYCTRVITDDRNPIWEESAALLVNPEYIKADEKLSVELWDSDRNTADDIVGKIEVSLQKMIQHPRKMYQQVSQLQGMDEGSSMPGELHWEVGYFGKPRLRPEMRTDGKNKQLPETLRDEPSLQDEKGVITTEEEDAVTHTPPDPLWPSGICSIVVHQIVNLQLVNIKGTQGSRKGHEYEPAKAYGENAEEQGGDLPTSYCTILLNDELVYRTRAKAVSSKPIFNAGTERFVRDWRSALVTVTVRDQRYREHDPILGVVPLKLSDVMRTSSQLTRWYPLDGGIGFGRIRISLLFRSVETKLPPQMLGWDVGTFEFRSDQIALKGYSHKVKIRLRTGGSMDKIPRSACKTGGDGNATIDLASLPGQVRLPVKHRYRSPVVFEFHNPGKRGAAAYSVLWLQHLVDNEDTPIDLPIWTTRRGDRLVQNYITEENYKSLGLESLNDLTEVGRLQFKARFVSGMDESHGRFVVDNDTRETFESWEACVSEGIRPAHGIALEVPEETRALHEKSLIDGRDMLRHGQQPPPAPPPPSSPPLTPPGNGSIPSKDSAPAKEPTTSNGSASSSSTSSTEETLSTMTSSPEKSGNKGNKRTERRKQRGMMQWKPARNAVFVKHEAQFALGKVKAKLGMGGLSGREPDVETETGG